MSNDPGLTLLNPKTGNSVTLSPRELTIIFDSVEFLSLTQSHLTEEANPLSIKLSDFCDNEGIPTED